MNSENANLSRLSQSQVAWLIGKPTVWLRDNGYLFERNEDGTYDGRQVFRAMAEMLGTVVISNAEWSQLFAAATNPANCEECIAGRPCEFHQRA